MIRFPNGHLHRDAAECLCRDCGARLSPPELQDPERFRCAVCLARRKSHRAKVKALRKEAA